MKNTLVVLLLLATVVLGYAYIADNYRLQLGDKGELTKTFRGDLTLPITATGEAGSSRPSASAPCSTRVSATRCAFR